MREWTMRIRTMVIVLVLALLLAVTAGCKKEPTGEPDVVGTTPAAEEPAESEEPTPTPLAELPLTLEPVASAFDQPVFVTGIPDGSGRLVVLEKSGRAWVLEDDVRLVEPLLDLSGVVSTQSEQGLLGMAFSPQFAEDQTVWVNYTRGDGATMISSFTVTGDKADPASEHVWLTIPQPYANHNGGMIAFGPDGMLYIGMGDGGSGGDPQGNGQNPASLLGKMLRIDVLLDGSANASTPYTAPTDNPFVSEPGWAPEIWALGLRNPWRFSFDRKTGDLWIGDVGQNAWEEIDFQPGASAGGENYGWSTWEATHPFPPEASPSAEGFTMPVLEYDRQTGTSITGGYVYRGSAQPALWGTYFYADFSFGRVWGLQRAADGSVQTRLLIDNDMLIASFGEDEDGELYVVDLNGGVYRMLGQ
ncbi:MAG: PQQ-dependent sugar dehydrogenase [Coriobacteriia bacterium]|nr:PQQ-dependent sugar dehydrogenase [Coriobacteriia bacterium]